MSANPKQHEQVWAKWEEWFDTTSHIVYAMYHDRELFQELRDAIVGIGPNEPAPWLHHYARLYLAKQAMAARRVMDRTDGAVSFWWVLHGIETSPQVLNRERFLAANPNRADWAVEERRAEFEGLRSPGGDWIDPKIIEYFRLTMEADVERLVVYATKTVAHTDPKGAPSLTWAEVSEIIDHIGRGFQSFGAMFHATHYEVLPYTEGDWKAPFRRNLFEPYKQWRNFDYIPGG